MHESFFFQKNKIKLVIKYFDDKSIYNSSFSNLYFISVQLLKLSTCYNSMTGNSLFYGELFFWTRYATSRWKLSKTVWRPLLLTLWQKKGTTETFTQILYCLDPILRWQPCYLMKVLFSLPPFLCLEFWQKTLKDLFIYYLTYLFT